jgi:endonuclease/exonuclease/phosphatase (EEP) superfamily protein YafD
VVAFLRFVAWDDIEVFAVLNTVSALLYLPAWVVTAAAGFGRRYLLAAGAVLIVVAQLFIVLPELTAAQPVPRWTAAAPTFRVLDANVYYRNTTLLAGYAKEIKAYHPQLVTMEEATPPGVTQLGKSGALADLPYHYEVSRYDPKAFFIASKYPLGPSHVVLFGGVPLMVQTTVELPAGPLTLWVVHTTAPVTESFAQWNGQLARIASLVKHRGSRDLLVVGDFNATWGNRGFRSILAQGMTDGAAARGRAFAMTWSQLKHPLPPLVRIDHVLTGSDIAVTTIRTDVGPGSDHSDLLATIARRRPTG